MDEGLKLQLGGCAWLDSGEQDHGRHPKRRSRSPRVLERAHGRRTCVRASVVIQPGRGSFHLPQERGGIGSLPSTQAVSAVMMVVNPYALHTVRNPGLAWSHP